MGTTASARWRLLHPALSQQLVDAKLQVHYAAQFATAMGISYLRRQPDDSHTNLGWKPEHQVLASREVGTGALQFQVAIRPANLALLVLRAGEVADYIALHGLSIDQAESSLRDVLSACGLNVRQLTFSRHYELPPHRLTAGGSFDASRTEALVELANWFANAAELLDEFRVATGSSEVRCWPHHFDIGTLVEFKPGVSSGAGMSPGDAMYRDPYFYVNAHPAPRLNPTTLPLEGNGIWNTEGWFGALLPASRLAEDSARQQEQIRKFLKSAFDACSDLLRA